MAICECFCLDKEAPSRFEPATVEVESVPDTETIVVYDLAPQPASLCLPYLSDNERAAITSFARARANSFATARLCARLVVSRILNCHPKCIDILAEPGAKPHLQAPSCIRFANAKWTQIGLSFSYADDRLLVAVAPGRDVGVDIECRYSACAPRRRNIAAIADAVFAPEQRLALTKAMPNRRATLFYEFWTQHEAYLKATGQGLALPRDKAGPVYDGCFVVDLELGGEYQAALAASKPSCAVYLVPGPLVQQLSAV
jgi:phosphopantetheinyl transferase